MKCRSIVLPLWKKPAANGPCGLPSGDARAGFAADLEWERALFDARWAVVSWPDQYSGRGASRM